MGRLMLKTEGPGNVDVWSLKCVPISSSDDGVDSLFSSSEKRVVRKKINKPVFGEKRCRSTSLAASFRNPYTWRQETSQVDRKS